MTLKEERKKLEALSYLTNTYRDYARLHGSLRSHCGDAFLQCLEVIYGEKKFGDVSGCLVMPFHLQVEAGTLLALSMLDPGQCCSGASASAWCC